MGVHYRYSPQGCVATDSIVADKLLTSADSGGVTPDTSPPPLADAPACTCNETQSDRLSQNSC